jgi:hypothetical protein
MPVHPKHGLACPVSDDLFVHGLLLSREKIKAGILKSSLL